MSPMLVKLDENLGQARVTFLKQAGYDAERAHDERLSGADDATVWRRACAEVRFFITLDLDFSDVRRFPPGTHPGILLLRPRTKGRQVVLAVLVRIVRDHPLETLKGCLTVADEVQTRVRRPPANNEPAQR